MKRYLIRVTSDARPGKGVDPTCSRLGYSEMDVRRKLKAEFPHCRVHSIREMFED